MFETTPNPRFQILTKESQFLQCLHNIQNTKIQQDVSEINTLAKHAPITLTLLDRLHWQP